MKPAWVCFSIGLAASLLILVWPLSPALSATDVFRSRLAAMIVTALLLAVAALYSRMGRAAAPLLIACAAAGTAALVMHFNSNATCVADYDGRPVVIGRALNGASREYLTNNPGLSASDILLDAGGVAERVWTPESIRTCRFWLSWGGLTGIPLVFACVAGLVLRRRFRYATVQPAVVRTGPALGKPRYDAFISYRHTEADKAMALEVLDAIESRGLRAAIDFRDFAPNEHFLTEMERCIRESRFVLCIVTPAYVDSDHCVEEAIISKTIDMSERTRRLVPLLFERVSLPVWLHGLVGIDFAASASVDPQQRLLGLLKG